MPRKYYIFAKYHQFNPQCNLFHGFLSKLFMIVLHLCWGSNVIKSCVIIEDILLLFWCICASRCEFERILVQSIHGRTTLKGGGEIFFTPPLRDFFAIPPSHEGYSPPWIYPTLKIFWTNTGGCKLFTPP